MEEWLGKVEEAMFTSLRRLCKAAIADYQGKPRTNWVIAGHPSQVSDTPHTSISGSVFGERHCILKGDVSVQVILTISQVIWCRDLTECLEVGGNHLEALEAFEKVNFEVRVFSRKAPNILLCKILSVVFIDMVKTNSLSQI